MITEHSCTVTVEGTIIAMRTCTPKIHMRGYNLQRQRSPGLFFMKPSFCFCLFLYVCVWTTFLLFLGCISFCSPGPPRIHLNVVQASNSQSFLDSQMVGFQVGATIPCFQEIYFLKQHRDHRDESTGKGAFCQV